MAQQCGFFNAEYHDGEYDRVYNAEQFAAYFASFIGNGIFGDSMEELVVLARTENNMSIDVSTGQAWVNGWWYRNDETLNMPIALADGILNRKDIVVLRWGNAERDMWLQVLQGEPSIEAIPPVIRRDADYFDLELCEIDVPAGTSKITQALIKDTRLDNNVCGFVTGVVDQIDTTALYLQFNQQFNDWFEAVKEQFEGDVPEILQAQIDDLFGIISDRIEKTSTSQHAYLNKDYFIYNNELCKATKSIAIGDTISPGIDTNDNCIYTTVADEIGTGGVTVVEELADIIAMTVFNGEAAGAKAVKNLNTGLSNKLNKSGDELLVIGDLATASNPAIHLRSTQREIRDAISTLGDYLLFDYTGGSVKNIVTSYKNGVNTFGGVGLRVNNGVAQYSPNNGTSWLNFKNPTGTKSITANGTYDVTDYASAQVNVGPLIQQVGPAVYVASQGYSWNGAEVGRYYAITISIHQGYNQTFEPPASMSGCQVISTTGVVLTYTPVATAERDRMRMYFVKATSTTLSITNVGQSALNVAWLAMRVGW